MKSGLLIIPVLLLLLTACEEETPIPKPPSYLRTELPDHTYTKYIDSCNYQFELADIYTVETAPGDSNSQCHRRIQLGPMNGTVYFRYWDMNESLSFYINNANDEVDMHKTKATNIIDKSFLRPKDRVFGTLFRLEGDVATPFQFYMTDSTDHFVYAEVLFNFPPNYDSLRPTLDYLEQDLQHLIETFQWAP
ncbi:MAG: gliding motility lipoprotein GldD [bacterium]|nr:gliding motility lipoprotein GldD [bacterium]